MIKDKRHDVIEIDLTGEQGNVFALMGIAKSICKEWDRIGANDVEIKVILDDMMSDDYEHALEVMEKYFGDYIIMYR